MGMHACRGSGFKKATGDQQQQKVETMQKQVFYFKKDQLFMKNIALTNYMPFS